MVSLHFNAVCERIDYCDATPFCANQIKLLFVLLFRVLYEFSFLSLNNHRHMLFESINPIKFGQEGE